VTKVKFTSPLMWQNFDPTGSFIHNLIFKILLERPWYITAKNTSLFNESMVNSIVSLTGPYYDYTSNFY